MRVALRNRKVRGWVVGQNIGSPPDSVSDIAALSGKGPVFDEPLLGAMREMASLTVSPLASFLSLLTPARLGRPSSGEWKGSLGMSPNPQVPSLVRLDPSVDVVTYYGDLIEQRMHFGEGTIVAVPEVKEGSRVIAGLAERFGREVAVVHSGLDPAERSAALWAAAAGKARVVLGGRAALFTPAFACGLIVVHAEHDQSFKEQRAPYYDARDVALVRGAYCGARVILASLTPSLASLARKDLSLVEPERAGARSRWPIVEVVEPPRVGVPRRAIAAIIETRNRGGRSMVFIPRTRSTRSGPGPQEVATFLARVVPGASISRADRPGMGDEPGALAKALAADVIVATEAAMAEVERPEVSTIVVLGLDQMMMKPSGRAIEDVFSMLWSLGCILAAGPKRGHVILETDATEHYVVQALTRGDHGYFVRHELEERRIADSPPFVRLVRVRGSGEAPKELFAELASISSSVLGPIPLDRGWEALLKVNDLSIVVGQLREIVSKSAARIHVEVDPREW